MIFPGKIQALGPILPTTFFARPAEVVARDLIGMSLMTCVGGQFAGGEIVETEAYHESEAACHGHRGQTPRNKSLFGRPGQTYIYRSYGLHWCLNCVTGAPGEGSAVLIRALSTTLGLETVRARRGAHIIRNFRLGSGPGNVGAALGITGAHDGIPLNGPIVFVFAAAEKLASPDVVSGPRIGITRAIELPWRFWRDGHRAVSGSRIRNTREKARVHGI